jgi:hypothetical protein
MQKLVVTLTLVLFAVPCFAQKVTHDWDRDFDFSKVSTFYYLESEENEENPLMHQRILNSLEYHLNMKGLYHVDKDPDIVVTYWSDAKEEVRVNSDHFGYGYGAGWYWGGGMGTTTSRVISHVKGTLVIDMWDAKAKRMIWRGTITDTVSDKPEKNEKKINKGMEKLFAKFPPDKK